MNYPGAHDLSVGLALGVTCWAEGIAWAGAPIKRLEPHDSLREFMPALLDRSCFIEWSEMTETRKEIYLIDDGMDRGRTRAARTARKFLHQFVGLNAWIPERPRSTTHPKSSGNWMISNIDDPTARHG